MTYFLQSCQPHGCVFLRRRWQKQTLNNTYSTDHTVSLLKTVQPVVSTNRCHRRPSPDFRRNLENTNHRSRDVFERNDSACHQEHCRHCELQVFSEMKPCKSPAKNQLTLHVCLLGLPHCQQKTFRVASCLLIWACFPESYTFLQTQFNKMLSK